MKHRYPSKWVIDENRKILEIDKQREAEGVTAMDKGGCVPYRINICKCFGPSTTCIDYIAGKCCAVDGIKHAAGEALTQIEKIANG